MTVASGIREVWFRHRETDDLLMLRTMILRRDRDRPFNLLAVVRPNRARIRPARFPGGRLRFILRHGPAEPPPDRPVAPTTS